MKTTYTPQPLDEESVEEAAPVDAEANRQALIGLRLAELMGKGIGAVEAAMQAEKENPPPRVAEKFEISMVLSSRNQKFISDVCKNQAQKETLVKHLIGKARADWRINLAGRYAEITDEKANTVPKHMLAQKAGI